MNNIIQVRVANNYGNRAVYPVCETAQKFAALLGTKTFTDAAIQRIKALGYKFLVQSETV